MAGLLPTAVGALRWNIGIVKTFAGLAGLPPEEKSAILERQLDVAHHELVHYARISMAAIVGLVVIAGVLVWLRGRSDAVGAGSPSDSGS